MHKSTTRPLSCSAAHGSNSTSTTVRRKRLASEISRDGDTEIYFILQAAYEASYVLLNSLSKQPNQPTNRPTDQSYQLAHLSRPRHAGPRRRGATSIKSHAQAARVCVCFHSPSTPSLYMQVAPSAAVVASTDPSTLQLTLHTTRLLTGSILHVQAPPADFCCQIMTDLSSPHVAILWPPTLDGAQATSRIQPECPDPA